jgi:L-serine dehydratase
MEECISVFDMLKIGVGPSSSYAWSMALPKGFAELKENQTLELVNYIKVNLYGSLSLTGKGHATDLAVMLGLSGQDPEYIPVENIDKIINDINTQKVLHLGNKQPFHSFQKKILFSIEIFYPFMPMD